VCVCVCVCVCVYCCPGLAAIAIKRNGVYSEYYSLSGGTGTMTLSCVVLISVENNSRPQPSALCEADLL
jgi:hypothetical protein